LYVALCLLVAEMALAAAAEGDDDRLCFTALVRWRE
jgi:hypothetical protein